MPVKVEIKNAAQIKEKVRRVVRNAYESMRSLSDLLAPN